jgi:hypothetical protein
VAGQPLTDERRAGLIARLGSVLSEEERDNLNAALARRPLIKRTGISPAQLLPTLRTIEVKKE